MNYYNEFDPKTAAWLRQLIADGLIPPGHVDERSIKDVKPDDLAGYTQCHFFAGVAGWSEALRLAGVHPDANIWTGSCPCQPFSVAGKGKGAKDERHLWPEFRRLIALGLPSIVVGEQVASAAGREWLNGVREDLQNMHLWSVFYENLHDVREGASDGKLPQILWEVIGRATASLHRMPETVRVGMERDTQGAEAPYAPKASTQGEGVSAGLRCKKQGKAAGDGGGPKVQEEGNCVRLGPTHRGDRITGPEAGMRDDGDTSLHGVPWDQMELPFDGPDRPDEGICPFQRSHCLFCNERCAGKLGGGGFDESHICVAGKEIADDDGRLAEAFGKVLASAAGRDWLVGVRADLEALGYAVGAADLCAAGVGAPHIRQRLYWGAWRVEDSNGERRETPAGVRREDQKGPTVAQPGELRQLSNGPFGPSRTGRLAESDGGECQGRADGEGCERDGTQAGRIEGHGEPESCCDYGRVADVPGGGFGIDGSASGSTGHVDERGEVGGVEYTSGAGSSPLREAHERGAGSSKPSRAGTPSRMADAELQYERPARTYTEGETDVAWVREGGFWSAFDLTPCRDGKARRIEPSSQPLAYGVPARVVRLRGYGNAIVPQVAAEFIQAFQEAMMEAQ